MICKYCKQEIDDNIKVCPFCGRKVSKIKNGFDKKSFSISPRNLAALGVMLAAIVIFVISLLYNMRPDPYAVAKASVTYIDDSGKITFLYNGKPLDGTFEVEIAAKHESLSGKTLSFLTKNGELYVVRKKGIDKVSDNVISYRMSADGRSIAYRNSVGELYLTKTSKVNPKQIDYNVIESNYCLSSDGETVAYLKTETTGDVMYYYNKKSVKYGSDRYPVLISDNARNVYTVDGSMNLYYSTKFGEERLICSNVEQTFACNSTYKNIIFYSDGATYLFTGKKEPVKLADTKLSLCTVSFAQKTTSSASDYFDNLVNVYGVGNFKNKAFEGEDKKLYYCNSSYSVNVVDENCSMINVVSGNNTAYYLKEGALYSVKLTSSKKSVVAENAENYYMASEGRYIYFLTSDGKLFAKRGKLDAKEIAENVSNAKISGYNFLFYSVSNGSKSSLYYTNKTKDGTKIAENVSEFGAGTSYAYYVETTENGAVYMYSKGNDDFRQRYQK